MSYTSWRVAADSVISSEEILRAGADTCSEQGSASRGPGRWLLVGKEISKVESQLQLRSSRLGFFAQGLRKADALPVWVWLEGRGI